MTYGPSDSARVRFFMLSFMRLGGVMLAFLGISILAKHWVEPAEIIGGVLIAIGAIDVLILPQILARRWRSPRP